MGAKKLFLQQRTTSMSNNDQPSANDVASKMYPHMPFATPRELCDHGRWHVHLQRHHEEADLEIRRASFHKRLESPAGECDRSDVEDNDLWALSSHQAWSCLVTVCSIMKLLLIR